MLLVDALGSKYRQQWRELTSVCREATIFHTYEWEELLRLGFDQEIPLFWGFWSDEVLVGIWPTSIVPTFGGNVLISLPHSNSGAPITREGFDVALGDVVARVSALVKTRRVIHWSVDIQKNSKYFDSMRVLGFKAAPAATADFSIDTTLGLDALWKQLEHSARRAVRKARRSGIEVWECTERNWLLEYQSIQESTMKRRHRKGLGREFFDLLYSLLMCSGKAKLFLAGRGNRVLAGNLLLLHRDTAYGWNAASRQDSWKMCPNELLLWHAIEWACKSGIRIFDLGPSPIDPSSGLNMFKRYFGAAQTDVIRFTLPINPYKHFLSTTVVATYRKLSKRGIVPGSVANWLHRSRWVD